jgi:hypothetical protein
VDTQGEYACSMVTMYYFLTPLSYIFLHRSKDEVYYHLSLDVVIPDGSPFSSDPVKASVSASITKFFEPEIRELRCEKCNSGTHARQATRIASK